MAAGASATPSVPPDRAGARRRRLLTAVGLATALLVSSGDPGADTVRRIQVAHSWWTDEPEVRQSDAPSFGVPGRDGRLRAYYGPGQSLVLLPADVVATAAVRLSGIGPPVDERARAALVSLLVFPLIAALTLLAAHALLLELGFEPDGAVCGALALQFATSLLAYTQLNQENSLLLLLDLLAFWSAARWIRTGRIGAVVAAYASVGFALLVRITALADVLALTLFLIGTAAWSAAPAERRRWWRLALIAAIVLAPFAVADRAYQTWRFGSPWSTYIHEFGAHHRALHPDAPADFPFSTPFPQGALGPFLSPHRSFLLTDPLVLATTALAATGWRRWRPTIRWFLAAIASLLFADVAFHAAYYDWAGAAAWGDRFVTVPVQLLAMLAVPLAASGWRSSGRLARTGFAALAAAALAIQGLSVVFWFNLEEAQALHAGRPVLLVLQRARNVLAVAAGRFDAWGLSYPGFTPRATRPNFLPFLLDGYLPPRVLLLLQSAWMVAAGVLVAWVARSAATAWRAALGAAPDPARDRAP
jgi:hypothetical protein